MKIIIVGCGNVGATLAEQLSSENHNITVIEEKEEVVEKISTLYDILGVAGNGASYNIQYEAGVEDADLLIAVTGSDEINLLCCLIAKKAGGCATIARVSNPVYSREIDFFKEELGLSMIVNPQLASANEMLKVLKFPSALRLDSFSKTRTELVTYRISDKSILCDMQLKDLGSKLKCDVLIPIVERGDEVIIPDGNFTLQARDEITVIGKQNNTGDFFKRQGLPTTAAKTAMIIGGGRTSIFLAKMLIDMGVKVKIIEKDPKKCEILTDMLPKATIIYGDATDKDLLIEEGIVETEAFVANTSFDEENIMLTLFAQSLTDAKLITKVHRVAYDNIIDNFDLGSLVYPKFITAESIIKYVRAMKNSMGSNIETLYRICDNRVEVMEFNVGKDSPVVGIPLQDLKLKPNMIIGAIGHKGTVSIPNGQSKICVGDTVILITTTKGLNDLSDVLR